MLYFLAYWRARSRSRAATAATMTSECNFAGVIKDSGLEQCKFKHMHENVHTAYAMLEAPSSPILMASSLLAGVGGLTAA